MTGLVTHLPYNTNMKNNTTKENIMTAQLDNKIVNIITWGNRFCVVQFPNCSETFTVQKWELSNISR